MQSAANSRCFRSFCLWLALLLFSRMASLTVQLPLHAEDNSDNWVSSTREANKASLVFITGNVKHKNGDVAPFAGTGFIVSPAGHVLTCNHVIPEYDPDVDTLQCSGSVGRYEPPYPLTIVDSEKQGDLILLILPQERTWTSIRSMAKGQLDSEIVVLGFPIDKPLLAATGRITSTERGRWITNAALNHGMSGGPAFNKSGAIIGIAEGGYEEANAINLLIPISYASRLLQIADSPLIVPSPQVSPTTSVSPSPASSPSSTPTTPAPGPMRELDPDSAVPVFVPNQSICAVTRTADGISIEFENNRNGSGVAYLSPSLDLRDVESLRIEAISSSTFMFRIEYKGTDNQHPIAASPPSVFPATTSSPRAIVLPVNYRGTVDEIVINLFKLGERSKVDRLRVFLLGRNPPE